MKPTDDEKKMDDMTADEVKARILGIESGGGDSGETPPKEKSAPAEEGKPGEEEENKGAQNADGGKQGEAGKEKEAGAGEGGGKNPEDKSKEDEATDEDKRGLDQKLPKEVQQAIIRERIRNRKEREALKADRDALDAQRRAVTEQPKRVEGQAQEGREAERGAKRLTVAELAFLFEHARRAESVSGGQFDEEIDADKAKQVLKYVDGVKASLSTVELVELRDALLTGKLGGEHARDVAALVEREIPFAQRRDEISRAREQGAEQQMRQMREVYNRELAKQYESYPEFKPLDGVDATKQKPELQFAVKWMDENLDDVDIERLKADPAKMLPRMFRQIKAALKADRAEQNEAELKKLKNIIDKAKGPVSAGGSVPSDGGSALSGSDEIKREIEEKFS